MKKYAIQILFFLTFLLPVYCQESNEIEKKVLIFGEVVDPFGKAVKGFSVNLIVERETIDLSTLTTSSKNRKVFSSETDDQGKYYFTWKLDDYYNRFYINYIVEGKFDDVQFLPPSEPVVDVSKAVGKEKNVELKLVVSYHPAWDKVQKLIEVYGRESDKGHVLRIAGFYEKETDEEIAGAKYTYWWYYSRGKCYKFSGDKLLKEFKYQPLDSLEKKN